MWAIWTTFGTLLLIGLPIAFVMGVGAVVGLLYYGFDLSLIVVRFGATVSNYNLASIPLFILAALLMNEGGVTNKIGEWCRAAVGWLPGGLSNVNIIDSMIFAGISGAAIADVSSIGVWIINEMKEDGYPAAYSAAVTAVSASVGPIIPPSIPMIVAGVATSQSIGRLFMAGLLPGVLMGLGMLVVSIWISSKRKYPRHQKLKMRQILMVTLKCLPDLIIPVVLIAGLVTGYYTPTEVAAVAVLAGLAMGFFLHRELTLAKLRHCAHETLILSGSIFIIIGFAATFSWLIVVNRIDQQIGMLLGNWIQHPVLILIATNIILILMGMFMETLSAMLIALPVFINLGNAIGMDPIQMTTIVVLNLVLGLLTPPIGLSIYIVSIITKEPWERVFKECLPFFIPNFTVLALVTYYPPISLWIPRLLM